MYNIYSRTIYRFSLDIYIVCAFKFMRTQKEITNKNESTDLFVNFNKMKRCDLFGMIPLIARCHSFIAINK